MYVGRSCGKLNRPSVSLSDTETDFQRVREMFGEKPCSLWEKWKGDVVSAVPFALDCTLIPVPNHMCT